MQTTFEKPFEETQEYRNEMELVPDSIKNKAISLLFPNQKISPVVIKKIHEYIDKNFQKLHCCVLYRVSSDFNSLCKQYGLDSRNREVIITEDFKILFSSNFYGPHSRPRPLKVN